MSFPWRSFDKDLPLFVKVTASAGTGKTHALAWRVIQILFSGPVNEERLGSVLAMTFTRNAAVEMRQRILHFLKEIALGDARRCIEAMECLPMDKDGLRATADAWLDLIFNRYSKFLISTIDSIASRIFKAGALEFDVSPNYDLSFETGSLLDSIFDRMSRTAATGSPMFQLFEEAAALLQDEDENLYRWNPLLTLLRLLKDRYGVLATRFDKIEAVDLSDELQLAHDRALQCLEEADKYIDVIGAERSKRYVTYCERARSKEGIRSTLSLKAPSDGAILKRINFPAVALERLDALLLDHASAAARYFELLSRQDTWPVMRFLELFSESFDEYKRRINTLTLDDIYRVLSQHITADTVPDTYIRTGVNLKHFLIDEFQDTSPIQWNCLRPLFENALSSGGSLFVVGDTKQSIYGFRGADWRIMSGLNADTFPSASQTFFNPELDTCWRSDGRIVDFVDDVFKRNLTAVIDGPAAGASGLTSYTATKSPGRSGIGHASVVQVPAGDDDQLHSTILGIVTDALKRGRRLQDILILARTNEEVNKVSAWLKDAGLQVITFSSLDARSRPCASEMISLLRFLDSPVDDLSFASFITGVCHNACSGRYGVLPSQPSVAELIESWSTGPGRTPLYIAYRNAFPEAWEYGFDRLFKASGYMPVYELLSEACAAFRVFECLPLEEASFAALMNEALNARAAGTVIADFVSASGPGSEPDSRKLRLPTAAKAVSVMTIHKAKGLSSPVVLALIGNWKPKIPRLWFNYSEKPEAYHLSKTIGERSPELARLYRMAADEQITDSLNSLYVALTRAVNELHVVSVCKTKDNGSMSDYARLLDVDGHQADPLPVADTTCGGSSDCPTKHASSSLIGARTAYSPFHYTSTRRGELVHDVLSMIDFMDEPSQEKFAGLLRASNLYHPGLHNVDELAAACMRLFLMPDVLALFARKPGRRVFNEYELCTHDGRVRRVDRLIADAGSLTIVDFKSGSDAGFEEHCGQVSEYVSLLGQLHPGLRTEGLLVYFDAGTVRRVV
jgi:ATP-dependent exoDNAse (exonuclease V) beta subunit